MRRVLAILVLLGASAGLATAEPRVVIEPPIFYPEVDFRFDDGYYRTRDGYYYHYDRDRHGWHYGRNHREGLRWEAHHHR